MTYLQIIKQMDAPKATQPPHTTSLRNEIDEIDEITPTTHGDNSSISSISFANDVSSATQESGAAIGTLRFWYGMGALADLPEHIPEFTGDLAQYSDRACLIGMVRLILRCVPWSLTAAERAVQFVAILTPIIEGA